MRGRIYSLVGWDFKSILISIMKCIPMILSAGLLVTSLVAQEATLIMETVSAGLPEGVKFPVKPMGYENGIKLGFFVEGKEFVEIKRNSLKAEGWKMGPFANVSKDGTQASFSISKKGDFVNKSSEVKVAGSIIIITGSDIDKKSAMVSTNSEIDIGPFKAQLKLNEGTKWGDNGIIIKGNLDSIKTIHAKVNGKMVKSNGWSGSNGMRVFIVKGLEDNTEVEIEYWKTKGEKVITFSK